VFDVCLSVAYIGPKSSNREALYVVEAADLKAATPGNSLCKYADDTYIIIPAVTLTPESMKLNTLKLGENTTTSP